METTTKTRLVNVEAGYAQVARTFASLGGRERIIGSVCQRKSGSTRTGTTWEAFSASGRRIGQADTREGAVDMLVAR